VASPSGSSNDAPLQTAIAPSADASSAGSAHTCKGKLPVGPVSLARRGAGLRVHRQYVVAELFTSIGGAGGGGLGFCLGDCGRVCFAGSITGCLR
jgi:hypothetical protein